jgi:predicted glycogen debranching enzyme
MSDAWVTHRIDLAGTDALDRLEQEWLLTNGTGAYAMGTVPAINTRRYHGLLVAATRPPVGRVVVLNQMLEQLVLSDGVAVSLSACRFCGQAGSTVYSPDGFRRLRAFEKGTSVAWRYQIGDVRMTRRLLLHERQQAATLVYRFEGLEGPAVLTLRPMVTLRDFHGLRRHAEGAAPRFEIRDRALIVREDQITATFACPDGGWSLEPDWWYDIHYPAETRRGQDDREDVLVPGRFDIDLGPADRSEVAFTVALGGEAAAPARSAQGRERALKRLSIPRLGPDPNGPSAALRIAADDFVVRREAAGRSLTTILAGYPWFADWGRDALIALPGLLLTTGRFDDARAVLASFASAMRGGLVPNRFDDYDASRAHYNTVDASLWFVHASMSYTRASGDAESWDKWLSAACIEVIEGYRRGAGMDEGDRIIRVDDDGLVTAGSAQTQLTWMDAATGGVVFTPRHGKAVEINGLWHHALSGLADLLDEGTAARLRLREQANRVRASFVDRFWLEDRGYLADHLAPDGHGGWRADVTVRPNQILAAGLAHGPLSQTMRRGVVDVVKRKLLTPCGLRTLPSDDPAYRGRYEGPAFARDGAYHQGTVWPWLMGSYVEALLRAEDFSDAAKREAAAALQPLLDHVKGDGLGQLHEIHQGDPPHEPDGCIAQAWSVAELLRAMELISGGGSL